MDSNALVWQSQFGSDSEQDQAHQELRQAVEAQGAQPSSLHTFYRARGRGEFDRLFTVPAFNLRGLSYLTATAALEVAQELQVGAFIFELARSEMKYTNQTPHQLTSAIYAAALQTKWTGPLFVQGDHYQPKPDQPGQIADGEETAIKQLVKDSLAAGIYNIDIDGSRLVDASQPTEYDQQRSNFLFTAEMIHYIQSLSTPETPVGAAINIGCEISEVGSHLSKSSQLSAFMTGLADEGEIAEADYPTKVAIETGTKHGGEVLRDGSAGPMFVDFQRLQAISMIARRKYGMAGAVQHGASTLTKNFFARFAEAEAAEIHLSTGLQNTLMDHPAFPQPLIDEMYDWCAKNCADERKPSWSEAQFYVKTRKKAWGAFKQQTWELDPAIQHELKEALKYEFRQYFQSLNVADTLEMVQTTTT